MRKASKSWNWGLPTQGFQMQHQARWHKKILGEKINYSFGN